MNVWRVGITRQQSIESGLRFVGSPGRHIESRPPGNQNLVALIRWNFTRKQRHPQQRQPKRLDDFWAVIAGLQEFGQHIIGYFKLLEVDIKQRGMVTRYGFELLITLQPKRAAAQQRNNRLIVFARLKLAQS